jgi:radical SAM protein with 4Fe4S-binding SPASM domain
MLANAVELNKVYFALAPDFMQRRDDKCLLIWSFLPYWMIVSQQMLAVLTQFNGRNTLQEIIDKTVSLSDIQPAQYESKVKKEVSKLLEAKILSTKPEKLSLDYVEDITSQIIEEITLEISDEENDDTVLNLEELKTIIRTIHKYVKNNAILRITGLKPAQDIQKLVALIKTATYKGLNIFIDLPSEAYTDEFINEISRMRVHVQITFDGAVSDINDAIQGKGAYERNVECVRNFLSKKVYTIMNLNTSEHNYQEMGHFLNLAKNTGVNECRVVPLKRTGKYKDFRTPDYREIIAYLLDALDKDPGLIRLLGRDILTIFEQLIRNNEHKPSCGAAKNQVFISADARVYPCIGYKLPQFEAGDLTAQPIDEIWEASSVLIQVRENTNVQSYQQCTKCVIRYWCRGGCRAESFVHTKSVNKPSPACKSIQMAFIDLFWKLAGREEFFKPKQPVC